MLLGVNSGGMHTRLSVLVYNGSIQDPAATMSALARRPCALPWGSAGRSGVHCLLMLMGRPSAHILPKRQTAANSKLPNRLGRSARMCIVYWAENQYVVCEV